MQLAFHISSCNVLLAPKLLHNYSHFKRRPLQVHAQCGSSLTAQQQRCKWHPLLPWNLSRFPLPSSNRARSVVAHGLFGGQKSKLDENDPRNRVLLIEVPVAEGDTIESLSERLSMPRDVIIRANQGSTILLPGSKLDFHIDGKKVLASVFGTSDPSKWPQPATPDLDPSIPRFRLGMNPDTLQPEFVQDTEETRVREVEALRQVQQEGAAQQTSKRSRRRRRQAASGVAEEAGTEGTGGDAGAAKAAQEEAARGPGDVDAVPGTGEGARKVGQREQWAREAAVQRSDAAGRGRQEVEVTGRGEASAGTSTKAERRERPRLAEGPPVVRAGPQALAERLLEERGEPSELRGQEGTRAAEVAAARDRERERERAREQKQGMHQGVGPPSAIANSFTAAGYLGGLALKGAVGFVIASIIFSGFRAYLYPRVDPTPGGKSPEDAVPPPRNPLQAGPMAAGRREGGALAAEGSAFGARSVGEGGPGRTLEGKAGENGAGSVPSIRKIREPLEERLRKTVAGKIVDSRYSRLPQTPTLSPSQSCAPPSPQHSPVQDPGSIPGTNGNGSGVPKPAPSWAQLPKVYFFRTRAGDVPVYDVTGGRAPTVYWPALVFEDPQDLQRFAVAHSAAWEKPQLQQMLNLVPGSLSLGHAQPPPPAAKTPSSEGNKVLAEGVAKPPGRRKGSRLLWPQEGSGVMEEGVVEVIEPADAAALFGAMGIRQVAFVRRGGLQLSANLSAPEFSAVLAAAAQVSAIEEIAALLRPARDTTAATSAAAHTAAPSPSPAPAHTPPPAESSFSQKSPGSKGRPQVKVVPGSARTAEAGQSSELDEAELGRLSRLAGVSERSAAEPAPEEASMVASTSVAPDKPAAAAKASTEDPRRPVASTRTAETPSRDDKAPVDRPSQTSAAGTTFTEEAVSRREQSGSRDPGAESRDFALESAEVPAERRDESPPVLAAEYADVGSVDSRVAGVNGLNGARPVGGREEERPAGASPVGDSESAGTTATAFPAVGILGDDKATVSDAEERAKRYRNMARQGGVAQESGASTRSSPQHILGKQRPPRWPRPKPPPVLQEEEPAKMAEPAPAATPEAERKGMQFLSGMYNRRRAGRSGPSDDLGPEAASQTAATGSATATTSPAPTASPASDPGDAPSGTMPLPRDPEDSESLKSAAGQPSDRLRDGLMGGEFDRERQGGVEVFWPKSGPRARRNWKPKKKDFQRSEAATKEEEEVRRNEQRAKVLAEILEGRERMVEAMAWWLALPFVAVPVRQAPGGGGGIVAYATADMAPEGSPPDPRVLGFEDRAEAEAAAWALQAQQSYQQQAEGTWRVRALSPEELLEEALEEDCTVAVFRKGELALQPGMSSEQLAGAAFKACQAQLQALYEAERKAGKEEEEEPEE